MRYYYIVMFKTFLKNFTINGAKQTLFYIVHTQSYHMSCWTKFKMLFIIFLTLLHILHTTIGTHEVDI